MKNLFLTLVLIVTATVGKSQVQTIEVKSTFLFEYPDTLSFDYAWDNQIVTNLNQTRYYNEGYTTWVIDLKNKTFTFGIEEPMDIIAIVNGKINYMNSSGNIGRVFFKDNSETGQSMIFFLEEPSDGKILGGFQYIE